LLTTHFLGGFAASRQYFSETWHKLTNPRCL